MNKLLILSVVLLNVSSQKINLSILYESLCPDSIKFINEQLYPSWAEIAPYTDLNFVPFGKSESQNGGLEFTCQHGPMECAGNKIQSCALNQLPDKNVQVQFVHCFMNSFAKKDVGQSCAEAVGINWDEIQHCYNSQNGIILQLNAEKITQNVSPKFVPTIMYNGVFDQADQDESQHNFKGVFCKHLNQIYPGICQQAL